MAKRTNYDEVLELQPPKPAEVIGGLTCFEGEDYDAQPMPGQRPDTTLGRFPGRTLPRPAALVVDE